MNRALVYDVMIGGRIVGELHYDWDDAYDSPRWRFRAGTGGEYDRERLTIDLTAALRVAIEDIAEGDRTLRWEAKIMKDALRAMDEEIYEILGNTDTD